MPSTNYLVDDPIFAALQALHYPPEELAQTLGVDLKTLWRYYGGEQILPDFMVRRLVQVLEERAGFLREVAGILAQGGRARNLAAVS